MRRIFIFLAVLPLLAQAQFNTDRLLMVGRSAIYYEDYVLSIQYFNQAISQKPWLWDSSLKKIRMFTVRIRKQDALHPRLRQQVLWLWKAR